MVNTTVIPEALSQDDEHTESRCSSSSSSDSDDGYKSLDELYKQDKGNDDTRIISLE